MVFVRNCCGCLTTHKPDRQTSTPVENPGPVFRSNRHVDRAGSKIWHPQHAAPIAQTETTAKNKDPQHSKTPVQEPRPKSWETAHAQYLRLESKLKNRFPAPFYKDGSDNFKEHVVNQLLTDLSEDSSFTAKDKQKILRNTYYQLVGTGEELDPMPIRKPAGILEGQLWETHKEYGTIAQEEKPAASAAARAPLDVAAPHSPTKTTRQPSASHIPSRGVIVDLEGCAEKRFPKWFDTIKNQDPYYHRKGNFVLNLISQAKGLGPDNRETLLKATKHAFNRLSGRQADTEMPTEKPKNELTARLWKVYQDYSRIPKRSNYKSTSNSPNET